MSPTPEDLDTIRNLVRSAFGRSIDERVALVDETAAQRPDLAARLTTLVATIDIAPTPGDTPSAINVGDRLDDRYRIDRFLGHGGMGQVFAAFDELLDIDVALKTIRFGSDGSTAVRGAVDRFKREVLLARTVSHPRVCRTYDLGCHIDDGDEVWFITMQLLDGEPLADRVTREAPLAPDQLRPILEQMAAALGAAHDAGIVHRDFKSGNVMIDGTNGDVDLSVMDFGLANAAEYHRHVAIDAAAVDDSRPPRLFPAGTPAYMAPEQVLGYPLTPAADIYALGVVLFELATGRRPFTGDTIWEVAMRRIVDEPPSPRAIVPELDERWDDVIVACLQIDPASRPQSGEDVLARLDAAPAPTAAPPLPNERDAFFGRDEELDEMARLVERGARLVTLLGPGGVGKTRLAVRYGRSADTFEGGIWFVDLIDADRESQVLHAIAAALGVSLGAEEPLDQLGFAIAGRPRSLVILDNCEQIADVVVRILSRWLGEPGEACFLITSRERLRVPGESVVDIEPLDPATAGRELFVDRARAVAPTFSADGESAPLVDDIVSSLDGLPLALELAAARLRMLGLEQLRDRLGDRLKLLAGGSRGRHRTLTATLDWSWDLLDPFERTVLVQASVFHGGFTVDAAEAVIDIEDGPDAPLVLDVLQSLVDKSWLRARAQDLAPRLDMFATIREYLTSKLEAEPKWAAASRRRHGTYFAQMGSTESLDALSRHGGQRRRQSLHTELDNVIAACEYAATAGQADIAVATYAAAVAILSLTGPATIAARLGETVIGMSSLDDDQRHDVAIRLGSTFRVLGQVTDARDLVDAAIAHYRARGDRTGLASALMTLGPILEDTDEDEFAERSYEEGLELARDIGDEVLEANFLGNLGAQASERTSTQGTELIEAALALHRRVGNRRMEGIVLASLALAIGRRGELAKAKELLERAVDVHREVDNRRFVGIALDNIGTIVSRLGSDEDAMRYYEASLIISRETGHMSFVGNTLCNIAIVHAVAGRLDAAIETISEAIDVVRRIGSARMTAVYLGNLGTMYREQGRFPDAKRTLEEALDHHRQAENRAQEGATLIGLGDLARDMGDSTLARRRYEEALDGAVRRGQRSERVFAMSSLGQLDVADGRIDDARRALESIDALVNEVSEADRRIHAARERLADSLDGSKR